VISFPVLRIFQISSSGFGVVFGEKPEFSLLGEWDLKIGLDEKVDRFQLMKAGGG